MMFFTDMNIKEIVLHSSVTQTEEQVYKQLQGIFHCPASEYPSNLGGIPEKFRERALSHIMEAEVWHIIFLINMFI